MKEFTSFFPKDNSNEEFLEIDFLQSIVINIYSFLLQKQGRNITDPEFGNPLLKYKFRLMTPDIYEEIRSDLESSINKYFPQIEGTFSIIVDDVNTKEIQNKTIYIRIVFPQLKNQISIIYDFETNEYLKLE